MGVANSFILSASNISQCNLYYIIMICILTDMLTGIFLGLLCKRSHLHGFCTLHSEFLNILQHINKRAAVLQGRPPHTGM